ncbi:MAG: hypothetical protein A2504_11545 [Bdellovibrionales bacterium RIFOXYD12_FULL_39_22]|nr:MAG: hypothetical protein A2385_16060 [Bdellovibrionales bacterium RIFOXYB1_FULL_39_21]OFZ44528.1 MAG: hypothetical protein A2485_06835 [Bdellovibrionales bacterium RIFOXYC12_FULL_39_17]OFZ49830.1 MAG: hypothetical protein A2404_00630 [Bdellovibrionales bacterium RIFOXYC1_FULL_39_130]OFZ71592.1 MAG: hypothetical protein A2451_01725 [Bdellovibrionales bacterium RIFOXYC2_FULL_39_8]OFZ76835.1 MAG: hypothetical protein A2560_05430 [Bdellovibrionales bacterium RIFOXYD1_FULL_39_84]OFZ95762.1 MAG:
MAIFKYKARNNRGELQSGEISAESVSQAQEQISQAGVYITELSEKTISFNPMSFLVPKVKMDDLMVFNGQLETVFSVGIPLMRGLEFIREQTINPTLKSALGDILHDLAEGLEFSQAVGKHPHIFDSTYQSLLVAGEATGELENILAKISDIISAKMDNRAKINSAIFYPKLVLTFLVIIFFISVYVIIPKMQGFYKNLKIELPAITRIMLTISEILTSPGFIIIAILLFGLFFHFRKQFVDKYLLNIHTLFLKIPIIGTIILEAEVNSFCTVLSLLLQNGIGQLESLKILRGVLSNRKMVETIAYCEKVIAEGRSLSFGLKSTKVFPPLLSNFITIGEEAGDIEKILEKMAVYYKKRVNHSLDNFSKLIEPLLLFVIFGAVMGLALAVFMPMWQMSSAIKH